MDAQGRITSAANGSSGGVTSLSAGTGISLSGSTGAITVTNSSPNQLTTTTGSPSYYGARAWVNFQGGNGNTAGTINGSVNVSSITVNSSGDYTVNFSTAMPDANYAVSGTSKQSSGTGTNVAAFWLSWNAGGSSVVNASYVRVMSATTNQGVVTNSWQTHVVVHR